MHKPTLILILISLSLPVAAEEERLVNIPMIFSQEGADIKTSACLQIKEKLYAPEHSNWDNFKTIPNDPEKSLTKMITALQTKDEQTFKELSHPKFIDENFETQKSAYFKQFEQIQINDVKGYLKFDNLIVQPTSTPII